MAGTTAHAIILGGLVATLALAPSLAAEATTEYPAARYDIGGRVLKCFQEPVIVDGEAKVAFELIDYAGLINGVQTEHDVLRFTFDSLDHVECKNHAHPLHPVGVSIEGFGEGTGVNR